MLKLYLK